MDETRARADHPLILTDPAGTGQDLPAADLILLSGTVHCPRADILRASRPQTVVAGPAGCLEGLPLNQLVLRPGRTERVLGVDVTASAVPGGLSYKVERPRS
ncbi:MAG: hypothetical protein PHU21_05030 [Elusimicrobia bacterium]|nr:hypothetical protein [Elusimicrobiota bacterium]